MATKNELEVKVDALEKSIEGLQSAIRRLAQQGTDQLTQISQLRDQLNEVKTDVNRLKNAPAKPPVAGVSRYE